MSVFRILLVNEQPFWQPGDWLEGAVELTWRERREVRGVRLKLSGVEHTEWTEMITTSNGTSTTSTPLTHSSTEKVADTVFTFWGYPRGSSNTATLEPGLYLWPFRIALPPNIAHASIENNDYGHVRYELTAYIDMPWKSDIEFSKRLHVVPRMALSGRPDLLQPITAGEKKQLKTLGLFANGSIEMTAVCEKRGFVPGDQLAVRIHVENNSGEAINGLKLTLTEKLDFSADISKRKSENELSTLSYNQKLESKAGAHDVSLSIPVPPGLPNPDFEGRYIKRSHFLTIRVLIDAIFTSDIRLKIPVVACSTSADSGIPPDIVPSIFNPNGLPREKFYPAIGDGTSVAPVCLDGLGYNPSDQVDLKNCVRYPTFYSGNFTLPDAVEKFNPALYHNLLQINSQLKQ